MHIGNAKMIPCGIILKTIIMSANMHSLYPSNARTIELLLVEDCISDVSLFKKMLKGAGMDERRLHITDVPRLKDAFTLLDHAFFDIILLDLNLIDIDGFKSVAALHAEIPHIPLIVYSGADDSNLKKHAMQCGAKQYLVKGKETGQSLLASIQRELCFTQPGTAFPAHNGLH